MRPTGTRAAGVFRPIASSVVMAIAGAFFGCGGDRAPGPGAGGGPPPAADRAALQPAELVKRGRLVDLTHPLSPQSLYWPTGSAFEHERLAWGVTEAGYWYAAAAFSAPEHLGTHLDAPVHFAEHGWTNADIPVERLFGAACVIDITDRASRNAEATLEPEDVRSWEAQHGAIPRDAIVLVRTGWSARWPDWNQYYGSPTPKDVATLRFPGVSQAAASLLVERGVAGVGIDTASVDPGVSTRFEAHQVLGRANIFNLENLTRLEGLPPVGALVIALPMKIEGGTGAPTRVVAILPAGS